MFNFLILSIWVRIILIPTLKLKISALVIFILTLQNGFIKDLLLTVFNHPLLFLALLHSCDNDISIIDFTYLPQRTRQTYFWLWFVSHVPPWIFLDMSTIFTVITASDIPLKGFLHFIILLMNLCADLKLIFNEHDWCKYRSKKWRPLVGSLQKLHIIMVS